MIDYQYVRISGPVTVTGTVSITQPVSITFASPQAVTQSGVWNIGTITTLTGITNTVATRLSGNMTSFGAPFSVGTGAPTVIATTNVSRVGIVITNRGANTVLVGPSDVSATGGYVASVAAGATVTISGSMVDTGPIYAVSTAGTANVYVSQVIRT